jgi:hypothetical protein
MKNKSILAATLSLLIAGCTSLESPPMRFGDGSYQVTIESAGFYVPVKRVELIQQATAHCRSMGKRMEQISANQNRGGMMLDHVLDLHYRCL